MCRAYLFYYFSLEYLQFFIVILGNEHDDEMSGSITSDRSGDYFDCNSNTRKLFPKSYSCGDNRLRPSRNSNQFNDEFSRIGHSQRYFLYY